MHSKNTWRTSVVFTFCLSLVIAASLLSLSPQVASSQPVAFVDFDTRERVTERKLAGWSEIPLAQDTPHLILNKVATETNFNAAGVTLHYTLLATNDGNVTLTGVSITDAKLGALTCTQPVSLAPTQTLYCTGTYVTTQADVDAGKVDNTANASGLFGQTPVAAAPATESVPATQTPHLSLTKAATELSFSAAFRPLHYTLVATNDGNVTLTGVSITDAKLGTLTCTQPVNLAPAAKLTCTGTYVTTQADMNAGKVDNTANASGRFGSTSVPATPATKSVPATYKLRHVYLPLVLNE